METVPRLAAPSRKFAEVVPERSRTFLPASWWDSQICQRGCHLYPDSGLFCSLPPHECSGAVPSIPPPPSPGTTMPGCHHIKRRERGSDGERQRDRCGAADYKHDCASKQNWTGEKKELSLKLIIYPWEENHSPPPPNPLPPGANCLRSTSVYIYYRSRSWWTRSKTTVYLRDW